MTRTKTKLSIGSIPELEQEIDTIAGLQVELDQLEAERTAEIHAVEERYGERIKSIRSVITARSKICAQFSTDHKHVLFQGDARSAETPLAEYGFRTGQRSLKTLAKWTWEKVRAKIMDLGLQDDLTRIEIKEDRPAIQRWGKTHNLRDIGLKEVQDESFWISPKADDTNRQSTRS